MDEAVLGMQEVNLAIQKVNSGFNLFQFGPVFYYVNTQMHSSLFNVALYTII